MLVRGAALLVVLVAAFGGSTIRLFVVPSTDRVVTADAVVVLAGDYGSRLDRALELMQLAVAPVLVLDGNPDSDVARRLCEETRPFEVVCLRPADDSTRSEARALGNLAKDRGWRTIVLITSKFHVTRARLLVQRCFKGDLRVVGTDAGFGPGRYTRAIAHEWGGLAHAGVWARGC